MDEKYFVGDSFHNVAGPLGMPTHIGVPGKPDDWKGTVVCVAGGIGAAPILPIARAFQRAGHEVITVLGARHSDLLILKDRLETASERLLVCTDDGSEGRKGFVTDVLKDLIVAQRSHGEDVHVVVAIGPAIMMKFCSETTRPFAVPTLVSLNTIMVDGTGMCGGCRVVVGGEMKYVCVDGPEFDGHLVDFDGMMRRQAMYRPEEAQALARYRCEAPECKAVAAATAVELADVGAHEPKVAAFREG
jgi:ferredoxin--NADP+ reductase